ncbi:MAG: CPBP family intramembrane metalloprotease [Verrucomicrobiales bacterium]|nr:CPBP family intramembrane metalloprotease [Verrucomicrobiales bacterium]
MRSLSALAVYFAWILIGGGLAAPWLYWGAQSLAESTSWEVARSLAGHPFHRYVHRCLLVMALVALPALARGLGVRRWADVGFRPGTKPGMIWRGWRTGVLVGLAMFLPALACEGLAGARVARWPEPGLAAALKVAEILVGALAVGIMEEALFRGVLFGGLRRSLGVGWAIAISSLVYAWVHFFERPDPPSVVMWQTGLGMVGQMMEGLVRGERLVPFFATLTLAGALLAWWYDRGGSLWFPMGVHSGWVVSMKVRGWLTAGAPAEGGVTGWMPSWDWLCLIGIVAAWLISVTWNAGIKRERQSLTGVSKESEVSLNE